MHSLFLGFSCIKVRSLIINNFKDLSNEYDHYSFNKTEINNIQDYAYQVPIIRFNNGNYDINMVKSFIFFIIFMKIKLKLYLKVTVHINLNHYKHKIIGF